MEYSNQIDSDGYHFIDELFNEGFQLIETAKIRLNGYI